MGEWNSYLIRSKESIEEETIREKDMLAQAWWIEIWRNYIKFFKLERSLIEIWNCAAMSCENIKNDYDWLEINYVVYGDRVCQLQLQFLSRFELFLIGKVVHIMRIIILFFHASLLFVHNLFAGRERRGGARWDGQGRGETTEKVHRHLRRQKDSTILLFCNWRSSSKMSARIAASATNCVDLSWSCRQRRWRRRRRRSWRRGWDLFAFQVQPGPRRPGCSSLGSWHQSDILTR